MEDKAQVEMKTKNVDAVPEEEAKTEEKKWRNEEEACIDKIKPITMKIQKI